MQLPAGGYWGGRLKAPLLIPAGGYKLGCVDVRHAVSCPPPAHGAGGLALVGRTLVGMTDGEGGAISPVRRGSAAVGGPRPVGSAKTSRPWLRSMIVVAAVVWALVAVGAHGALMSAEHHSAHAAHPLLTSLGAEFAVNVDHAHLVGGSAASHHPEQFASAVLPNLPALSLAALGVVVAVLALAAMPDGLVLPAGRGPPGGLALVVTGRDRLTRFCLARR